MKHKLAAKMLSLLLAVVLCATAFAVPAFASGGDETAPTVETEPTEATDEGTADIQFQIPDELWDMLLSLFGSGDTEEEVETTRTGTVTTNGGKLNVRTGPAASSSLQWRRKPETCSISSLTGMTRAQKRCIF